MCQVILDSLRRETFRQGDDSEEIVYRQLQLYKQEQEIEKKFMDFVHGAQITVQHSDNIWKDGTCFSPFDFFVQWKTKILIVSLKTGKQKLDFIVSSREFRSCIRSGGFGTILKIVT